MHPQQRNPSWMLTGSAHRQPMQEERLAIPSQSSHVDNRGADPRRNASKIQQQQAMRASNMQAPQWRPPVESKPRVPPKQRVEIELVSDDDDNTAHGTKNRHQNHHQNSLFQSKPEFMDEITTNESSTKKFNIIRRGGSGLSSELSDKEFRSTLMNAKRKFMEEPSNPVEEICVSDDEEDQPPPKKQPPPPPPSYLPGGLALKKAQQRPFTGNIINQMAQRDSRDTRPPPKSALSAQMPVAANPSVDETFKYKGKTREIWEGNVLEREWEKERIREAEQAEKGHEGGRMSTILSTVKELRGKIPILALRGPSHTHAVREPSPQPQQQDKQPEAVEAPPEKPTFFSEEKFSKLVSGVYKGNLGSSNKLAQLLPSDRNAVRESFSSRYEVLETLGEGGSCVVRKVKSKKDDKFYAIKSSKSLDQSTTAYIKREFKMLKMMSHPFVIQADSLFSSNTSVSVDNTDSSRIEILRGRIVDQYHEDHWGFGRVRSQGHRPGDCSCSEVLP